MAYANGELVKARRWVDKALAEDGGHPGARTLLQRFKTNAPTIRARAR